MKIKVNKSDFELKFSFKGEMLFEQITGRTFSGEGMTDWITFLFCHCVANDKDFMAYDEYLTWISDNPGVFYEFIEEYGEYVKKLTKIRNAIAEKKTKQTKKS